MEGPPLGTEGEGEVYLVDLVELSDAVGFGEGRAFLLFPSFCHPDQGEGS